jgi:hypothetical protein
MRDSSNPATRVPVEPAIQPGAGGTTAKGHTNATARRIGGRHNWYRRYIRYKCNAQSGVVDPCAIKKLGLTREGCLTGKVYRRSATALKLEDNQPAGTL